MENNIVDPPADAHSPDNMEQVKTISQDAKNIAVIIWIGTIFFGFIPGLVFYLIYKDDDYIQDQSKEALNWSITAIIAYAIALLLTFVVIGVLLLPLVGLCHLIFCIMGAIATSNGKAFRTPFALRLLQ
ncbi:MAG: DUF4870 domain-containing protein [Spongiibacteraceae bacterium]|jgi:uncharacterized Tic20 family protein